MRAETILQREIRDHLSSKGLKSVHVANGATLGGGAKKRAIQMNSLKKDGLTVGFPDLIVYGPGGFMGHIEVKLEGEKLHASQEEVRDWMGEWGHGYAVCRSLDDVDETLEKWNWLP